MSDLRVHFAAAFGEPQALLLEAAVASHAPSLRVRLDRGSDPFRFALVWAVGLECLSRPAFRDDHRITVPWDELRAWLRDADLLTGYDGTFDDGGYAAGCFSGILVDPSDEDVERGGVAALSWLLTTNPAVAV